jgi:hypothetical protein
MKKFNDFIIEEKDDDTQADTQKAVVNFITSNFYRFINSPDESDNKSLLMLVAALSVLNTNQSNAVQVARRLAQMALVRSGRKKG